MIGLANLTSCTYIFASCIVLDNTFFSINSNKRILNLQKSRILKRITVYKIVFLPVDSHSLSSVVVFPVHCLFTRFAAYIVLFHSAPEINRKGHLMSRFGAKCYTVFAAVIILIDLIIGFNTFSLFMGSWQSWTMFVYTIINYYIVCFYFNFIISYFTSFTVLEPNGNGQFKPNDISLSWLWVSIFDVCLHERCLRY